MGDETRDENGRLTSRMLAGLVVDALIDAAIMKKEDCKKAIEIATVEIEVRKAMGDY